MKFPCCSLLCLLYSILHVASASAQSSGGATATGTSRAFNPAISANGLFLGVYTSRAHEDEHHEGEEPPEEEEHEHGHAHGVPGTGLHVQETELQLSSFVDPYLKADVILAMHGTEGIELEEGYVTTLGLPGNLTLKTGKFLADLGKHNPLHTHQFAFVDAPLVHARILGGEGLNETGIGVGLLLPTSWYAELSGQILNGDNPVFAAPEGEDLAYLGRLRSCWDLAESTTLELGGSYAAGKNQNEGMSQLAGGDVTIKWRPPRRALYRTLILQAEYLYASQEHASETERVGGFYALAQYQLARRWWAQARWDLFGLPEEGAREYRISGLLGFVPSEFSSLRLQYNWLDEDHETVNKLFLQYNFTIGSHPAHRY